MRILLDENVPYAVKRLLTTLGHQADHVTDAGLEGLENGELVRSIQGRYDLLITNDKDFAAQKNLKPTPEMGVILLRLGTTKAAEEIAEVERLFRDAKPETYVGNLTIHTGR